MLNLRLRVSVRRGAHTGFVREESARDAVADGFLHRDADDTAGGGRRVEGALDYHLEGRDYHAGVRGEDVEAAEDVAHGHDRDELLGDGGEARRAAEEDESADDGEDYADEELVDAEGEVEGLSDRVRLDGVSNHAEGDDYAYREEHRERLALKPFADVVGGASRDFAGGSSDFVGLGEDGFGEDRSHAEERRAPDPEKGSGASHRKSRGDSDDVSRSDLRRDRRRKRLEGAHTVLAGLSAGEGELSEGVFDAQAELADLDEAEPQREVEARAAEKRNKTEITPEVTVEGRYELC